MSEKHKNTGKYLNYVKQLLILASTITSCVSIYAIASLVCLYVANTSSTIGLKISVITGGIKRYKSIIKKKKKNHDKIVLLGKDKVNTTEVLISKPLIDSYISHDKLVSVNCVLKEYSKIWKKKEKKS